MAHAKESARLAPPHDARKRLAVLRNRAPGRLRRLAEAAPNPRSAVHTDGRPNAAAYTDGRLNTAAPTDGRPSAAAHTNMAAHADAHTAPAADIAADGDGRPNADTNAAATAPRES